MHAHAPDFRSGWTRWLMCCDEYRESLAYAAGLQPSHYNTWPCLCRLSPTMPLDSAATQVSPSSKQDAAGSDPSEAAAGSPLLWPDGSGEATLRASATAEAVQCSRCSGRSAAECSAVALRNSDGVFVMQQQTAAQAAQPAADSKAAHSKAAAEAAGNAATSSPSGHRTAPELTMAAPAQTFTEALEDDAESPPIGVKRRRKCTAPIVSPSDSFHSTHSDRWA